MTVDILFPYYGDVALMKQAVRSVLHQTNTDWRLIVVDDGYPDDSIPGWFESLNDDRVTYMRNEKNLGANGNYRKCLGFVENELVVVMGADDVMLPNYIDWFVHAAEAHPEANIFQPGVFVIDENNAPSNTMVEKTKAYYRPDQTTVLDGEGLAVSILRGDWLYFPSLGWRAETIVGLGFREGFDVVQDMCLVMDVAMTGGALFYDETAAFMYRRHKASDSSWRALDGTRFDEERRFFETMAEEMGAMGWSKAATVARLHVSSRLHAASLLPKAAQAKNWGGVKNLASHLVK
ncbi:glycosyltransferase [Kocuria koreensis]|jgi:glycosyltransferase involved in cell wall biosynthesis|uniref:Glycosyltransferase n=1 Tax=Rothia koreensis TaxID=592378 RepID=A0A7K1LKI1_9MICC|nr:glycosyltransferase family 2 protein [Rothia koreensis]MUN55714.1 glycosyltransferase [Rothia koreensis]